MDHVHEFDILEYSYVTFTNPTHPIVVNEQNRNAFVYFVI